MKGMSELLEISDIITIHVPLNKHTTRMINDKTMKIMKKNSFLINTSRAEIVDENALIEHKEKFRGIGLDVCSENLMEKLNHNNLKITNHIAAQGEESFKKMCLEPIKKFFFEQ